MGPKHDPIRNKLGLPPLIGPAMVAAGTTVFFISRQIEKSYTFCSVRRHLGLIQETREGKHSHVH